MKMIFDNVSMSSSWGLLFLDWALTALHQLPAPLRIGLRSLPLVFGTFTPRSPLFWPIRSHDPLRIFTPLRFLAPRSFLLPLGLTCCQLRMCMLGVYSLRWLSWGSNLLSRWIKGRLNRRRRCSRCSSCNKWKLRLWIFPVRRCPRSGGNMPDR